MKITMPTFLEELEERGIPLCMLLLGLCPCWDAWDACTRDTPCRGYWVPGAVERFCMKWGWMESWWAVLMKSWWVALWVAWSPRLASIAATALCTWVVVQVLLLKCLSFLDLQRNHKVIKILCSWASVELSLIKICKTCYIPFFLEVENQFLRKDWKWTKQL